MSKIVLTAVLFFPLLPSFHAEGQDEKRFQMTATDQAFYRVVTDFNLFRPLGWQSPDNSPKYELIATKIPADGQAKALIRESRSDRTYYVSMGDQLESAKVTKISTDQVYLKISQENVTLTRPDVQFLRLGVSRSTSSRGGDQGGIEANSERRRESDKSSRKDSLGRGGGKSRRGGSWSKGGSKSSRESSSDKGNKGSSGTPSGKGSARLQAEDRSSYFGGGK